MTPDTPRTPLYDELVQALAFDPVSITADDPLPLPTFDLAPDVIQPLAETLAPVELESTLWS